MVYDVAGCSVVPVPGEQDLATRASLSHTLRQIERARRPAVVDLSDTTFVDVRFGRLLETAHAHARTHQLGFAVLLPDGAEPQVVRMLLELLPLTGGVPIARTLDSAVAIATRTPRQRQTESIAARWQAARRTGWRERARAQRLTLERDLLVADLRDQLSQCKATVTAGRSQARLGHA